MYDAIVAGAGPAGNLAAFRLSAMGHRVVVLDRRHVIGDKLCTGIIGAECARRFPPDQAHIHRETCGATFVSPSGKRYPITRSEPQAFVIDRVAYVDSVARDAIGAGATYKLGVEVTGIDVSGQGVVVQTSGESGQERHQAQVLVIASGFGSNLLSKVGLRAGGPRDYMLGSQAEVAVEGLKDTEVYLGQEVAPGSFGWLVPNGNSRALVGVVSRGKLNGHMGRLLSSLQRDGRIGRVTKEPTRWGIPLKPLPKTYADRVLVVGDAAGLAKPTTGGGIYYALLSGEMAAETVDDALSAEDYSARRLKRYERKWRATFGRELRVGYYARVLYEAMGDAQIERLLDRFASREVQDELLNSGDFSFDWHSRVILKSVSHKDLRPLITSFGPIVTGLLLRLIRPGS